MKPAFVHVLPNLFWPQICIPQICQPHYWFQIKYFPSRLTWASTVMYYCFCYSTGSVSFWVKPNHHPCFQVSIISWQKPFHIDVHVVNFKNNPYSSSSCSQMYEVKKWMNFYLPHQTWVNVPPGLCYQTVSWDRYRLFLDRGQQWRSLLMAKIYIK